MKESRMGAKMNSRERILTALHCQKPDHVPLCLDMHPSYRSGPLANAQTQFDVLDILSPLGLDQTVDIWFPIQAPDPAVKITYWREKDPDGDGYLRCKRYDTPAGPLRQIVRETHDWESPDHCFFSRTTCGERSTRTPDLEMLDDYNAPRSKEFLIKSEQDLDRMEYLFKPLSGDALAAWRQEALFAKNEAQKRNLMIHARRTFNGSAVLWLCDPEFFMCQMVENPVFVQRFLRIIQDWQNWACGLVLDVGVDMISRFGLYEGPSYWGNKYFEKYLKPLIEEETAIIHQAGALHAQGQSEGITSYLESFKDMKIDVLMGIDEVQAHDDFDLLKKAFKGKKALWGGVNSDVTLGQGSDGDIAKAVKRAMDLLAPEGGFILWPVWSVYYQVPWNNVESLIRAWEKYC
jgi:hypothetical protein